MIIDKRRNSRGKAAGTKKRKSPKHKCVPFELKYKAVKLYLEEGYNAKLIGEELGVGSGTVTKWVKMYREKGEAGLQPRYSGKRKAKVPSAVKKKAIELKKANPEHGSRRISHMLKRMFFMGASPETVRKTLKEENLIERPKRKPKKNPSRPRFFERATPNQMWQTDIFTFRLGGRNAYLIGFIDDYSRFITGMGMFRSQKATQLLETFRRAAAEYRVPKEMLTDNGRQYTNWRGKSQFERELAKDRIKHIKSTPHHPMTLGKIERFWKTIFGEFLSRVQFDDFDEAQERLKLWIKYYNYRRPHQGIGGLCPADRFFEVQSEMKNVLSRGIEENVLEMALRGKPKKPFYMVGRWGDQSVVLHAEKGKVKMMVDGEERKEDRKIEYEINEEIKDERKDDNAEREEAGEERAADIQCEREVPGGAFDMVGEAETLGNMQGNGGELDDPEPVAEEGVIGDDEGAGAEEAGGRGPWSGVGREAGEAVEEDEPAGEAGVETGEEAGRDPGGEEEINVCPQPSEGVIYLRRDQVPEILEILKNMKSERSQDVAQKEDSGERGDGPGTCGSDNESAVQADDGNGGGEAAGSEPEDVLQVGEPGSGRDALGTGGQGLRATLLPGGWREREYQEDGDEDAEGFAEVGAEAFDTNVYGG